MPGIFPENIISYLLHVATDQRYEFNADIWSTVTEAKHLS